jgi:hypothetical protein
VCRLSYGAALWRDEPGVGRRVAAWCRVKTAGAAERNSVSKTKHPVLLMDMCCLLYPADFRQAF